MPARKRISMKRAGAPDEQAEWTPAGIWCPYCEAPLANALATGVTFGRRCECGATVTAVAEGEAAESAGADPAAFATAFRRIRARIRAGTAGVVGHDAAVDRLAIAAVRHLAGGMHTGQRILLVGPSGSGKTTLVLALARALNLPAAAADMAITAEVNWVGASAATVLAELYAACDNNLDLLARSCLLLDEVDKIAYRGAIGVARDYARGRQESLLALLGGGVDVRFQTDGDRGPSLSVRTDGMLIVGAGAFDGLPAEPTPGDLVQYGYMPELASRFARIITLRPLGADQLVPVLRRGIAGGVGLAREFGFDVQVSDAVLRLVADVLVTARDSVTPRAGVAWVAAAIEEALVRLLDLEARAGTIYQVRPDDVPIPSPLLRRSERR